MKGKEREVGINKVTKKEDETPAINTIEICSRERYTPKDLDKGGEEEMQKFLRAISVALLSYSHKMKEESKND